MRDGAGGLRRDRSLSVVQSTSCRSRVRPKPSSILDAGPCDYAVIEFSRNGAAAPVLAHIPARGLALCGEWFGKDSKRYVVIGRGSVPPTGDDWTSFIVASPRVRDVDSFCSGADLRMRATPVDGRELFVVDIGTHADDPRLSSILEKWDGVALGAYPDTGADS